MLTELTIDDGHIGKVVGPANGFLVDLVQTRSMAKNDFPQWSESKSHWLTCYCQLRGSGDLRDIFAVNPSQSPSPSWVGKRRLWVQGCSIPYRGNGLMVLCLPAGSQWEVTLSDVPLTRRDLDARAEAARREELEETIAGMRADFDAKHHRPGDLGDLMPAPERERHMVSIQRG